MNMMINGNGKYELTFDDLDYIKETSERRFIEITNNDQMNGRNPTTLMNSIVKGNKIEYGVHKILSGSTQNTRDFDVKDVYSYNHDIITSDGKLVEVKSVEEISDWLNFNLKTHIDYNNKTLAYYDTFLKNCHLLDFLITAYEINNTVYIRHIIDAKTFKDFVKESRKMNNGSTHYYNVRTAINQNKCIILNHN